MDFIFMIGFRVTSPTEIHIIHFHTDSIIIFSLQIIRFLEEHPFIVSLHQSPVLVVSLGKLLNKEPNMGD